MACPAPVCQAGSDRARLGGAPENFDALLDRLPAPPLRVGLGDRDAIDVRADDRALLGDRQVRPIRYEPLGRSRLVLAEEQVGAHRLIEVALCGAYRVLSSLDLDAVLLGA